MGGPSRITKRISSASNGEIEGGALIRYTVTPVKDPETQRVLGALVSGDIVNGKPQIPVRTLSTHNGGYSAIYLYLPTEEFALAYRCSGGNERGPSRRFAIGPGGTLAASTQQNTQQYTLDIALADHRYYINL